MEIAEHVGNLLDRFRLEGETDDVYFSLLELGSKALPVLIDRLASEPDPGIRRFLIHMIWQARDEAAVPTLLNALDDPDDEASLQAIDGLVAIGGEHAKQGVVAARARQPAGHPRASWLEEALDQMEHGLFGEDERPGRAIDAAPRPQ